LDDRSEERQAEGRVWKMVAQPGGAEGWVAADFLTASPPAAPAGSPVPSPAAIASLTSVIIGASATAVPSSRPGAVRVAPQGADCPTTHPIKANATSSLYYASADTAYATSRPDACFASQADAETAGFKAASR
jgi:hypothetical protein